jgi:hypothetical protein
MYQPWFPQLLEEALQPPEISKTTTANAGDDNKNTPIDISDLPCGSNSFFRQLDHMIATLCNDEFAHLYGLTRDVLFLHGDDTTTGILSSDEPTKDLIQKYSNLKAALFARYRTLSELLGVCLVREAQRLQLNCMLETSGRDVAMFHYVDTFFPAGDDDDGSSSCPYNKLALHFTVNDLRCAQDSVDLRMVDEIKAGVAALEQADALAIINANAGGPYGSDVLEGVQRDSDRVWNENVLSGQVGRDWYKASIQINARASEAWTAQAIKADGTLGTEFTFERK